MPSFFLVGYQTPKQSLREKDSHKSFPVDIHRIRDTTMSVALASQLAGQGYRFGGQILNLPSDKPIVNERPSLPPIAPGDVLILPTRPPLDDADAGPRRRVDQGGNSVEQSLFASLRAAFDKLNRGSMFLSERVMEAISHPSMDSEVSADASQYESLKINKYGDAAEITSLSGRSLDHERTVGVLLWLAVPEIADNVKLLVAFGMGGYQTLVWSWILDSNPKLIEDCLSVSSNRFLMVEFQSPGVVPYPHVTFSDIDLKRRTVFDILFD